MSEQKFDEFEMCSFAAVHEQHCFIRFDPERTSQKWTVFCCGERLADTDFPIRILIAHIANHKL